MENENPVMKEFLAGFAGFIKSFWKKAATQGMLVMTLLMMIVGLILWVDNRNKEIRVQRMEFKAEIAELRNEYRHEIAVLRTMVDSLRTGLEDCNAARIRVEGQNAALMALLKEKKR